MSILQEAMDLVQGDRRIDYGDIATYFARIAAFWSTYLDAHVTTLDVAKMMMLLKIARAKHNNHRDSYIMKDKSDDNRRSLTYSEQVRCGIKS